jgi:hypothetical protein
MIRSLEQVIDSETGRVSGYRYCRRDAAESLAQEVYVRLLAGTLTLDSRTPLTGRLRCEVTNATGENVEVGVWFREIGNAR